MNLPNFKALFIFLLIHFSCKQLHAQSWVPFPPGGINGSVNASVVFNGDLIVAGYFTMAGYTPAYHIARWDGSVWHPLGAGLNGRVNTMAVYNNKLYVGGYFTMAGGQTAQHIAKWNGSSWADAGDFATPVFALTVYNNKLVAGGFFTSANGVPANAIAQYNGTSWSAIGSGITGYSAQVMSLHVHNGALYIGGNFTNAGGVAVTNIASYNGTSWSPLGSGVNNMVYSFASYNNQLFVGGYFTIAGGATANSIASWNGSSWTTYGSGMTGNIYHPSIYVFALNVFQGKLIAGGGFVYSNGVLTNGIATWDGSSWGTLANGLTFTNYSLSGANTLCNYGNALFVGGEYSVGFPYTSNVTLWYDPVNPLAVTFNATNTSCPGNYDGSIQALASGGTPPYTYLWSTGDTTSGISNLSEGVYNLVVSDAYVSDTLNYSMNATYSAPDTSITLSGPTTFAYGGSVVLTAAANSSYYWSTGDTTQSIVVTNSGYYDVTVTNANGCMATSYPVIIVVTNPTMLLSFNGMNTPCAGTSGGSIQAIVNGGHPPYSYQWSTGDTTSVISNLMEGIYYLTVTDSFSSVSDFYILNATYPSPNANISPAGPFFICEGNTVVLNADSNASYLWSSGDSTQSITVDSTGWYEVTITDSNGCSALSNGVLVYVDPAPCSSYIEVMLLLQGYYDGSTMVATLLNQGEVTQFGDCDSIDVELHYDFAPYAIAASQRVVVQQIGYTLCIFPYMNGNYYIVVRHRNSLETWSALPQQIGVFTQYDFTSSASQAYGSNQIEVSPGVFAFYTGEINQDENIDLLDLNFVQNDILNFAYGYVATDINGDGNVDLLDTPAIDDNINNFIFSMHP